MAGRPSPRELTGEIEAAAVRQSEIAAGQAERLPLQDPERSRHVADGDG